MKFTEIAQPLPMAVPIANDGDKNIIPLNSTKTNLASLKDGFPEITQKSPDEGGLPPVRADFNGMFYLSTDQRTYLQNGGVITFSQSVSDEIGGYPKGAILDFVDDKSRIYMKVRSLIDDNTYDFVKDISFIDDVHWEKLKFCGSGVELGTVVCMPFGVDESENKYRYLNGQVIIQTQYPAFTTKVKSWQETRSSLFTTETNWQAEKTASVLGQCGKFVIDDTAGTIRLPLVININGLTDLSKVGVIKEESLPNFRGAFTAGAGTGPDVNASGIVKSTSRASIFGNGTGTSKNFIDEIDASNYSSTYQDGAQVQQEAVQYPYVICVNTGVEEAERPINDYTVNNPYAYGMSQYYQGVMNNNSWLKSNGQWNSGTVYTDFYNWVLDNTNNNKEGFKLSTATDITDYDFVVNTTEQTFRLPLLNGSEDIAGIETSTEPIGVAGAHYVAPYNGECTATALVANGGFFVTNKSSSVAVGMGGHINGVSVDYTVKVKRGDIVQVDYTNVSNGKIIWSKAIGNGTLYYYCGETLQNVDLINIARIQEQLVDKTSAVQAAHAAMPSDKYIDLTLGASGTPYTAPADGYFFVAKLMTAAENVLALAYNEKINDTYVFQSYMRGAGSAYLQAVWIPAKKGREVVCNYDGTGACSVFRFYYAEGAQ